MNSSTDAAGLGPCLVTDCLGWARELFSELSFHPHWEIYQIVSSLLLIKHLNVVQKVQDLKQ